MGIGLTFHVKGIGLRFQDESGNRPQIQEIGENRPQIPGKWGGGGYKSKIPGSKWDMSLVSGIGSE